jgi:prepilin-type N-terminal cleavage/methylation domain-containing protein
MKRMLTKADRLAEVAHRPPAAGGFTLIELVTVMAIIAILTAIAIPNYFQFIARGHRSEARATLTHAAQWMERWRTENGSYLRINACRVPADPPASGTAMYNITAATTAATYVDGNARRAHERRWLWKPDSRRHGPAR